MKNLLNILEQYKPKSGAAPINIPSDYFDDDVSISPNNSSTDNSDEKDNTGLADILSTGGSGSSSTVGELKFSSDTESINVAKDEAKQDADDYTNDHISIEDKSTSPTNQDRVVLVGKTLNKTDHFFPVEKNASGKYGWIDDSPEGDGEWNDFTQY
jgi:hypothetical protein